MLFHGRVPTPEGAPGRAVGTNHLPGGPHPRLHPSVPEVPAHFHDTVRRNGLQVVRLGAALLVSIGGALLGAQEATVWIDGEEAAARGGPGCSGRKPQPGA
jgi:hypothetical protein